jgi:hypothetical protein
MARSAGADGATWHGAADEEMAGIESDAWRPVALIEVAQETRDIADLLRESALKFRLVRAFAAPPGYHRYELFVDTGDGARRVARTSWAILVALKKAAAEGLLLEFRIVTGGQWLTLGDNAAAMGVDGMSPNIAGGV